MDHITYNQKILGGKPIIEGTRISVEFILELLGSGMTSEEIIKEYPQLKKGDVLACLQFATNIVKREELIPV